MNCVVPWINAFIVVCTVHTLFVALYKLCLLTSEENSIIDVHVY